MTIDCRRFRFCMNRGSGPSMDESDEEALSLTNVGPDEVGFNIFFLNHVKKCKK